MTLRAERIVAGVMHYFLGPEASEPPICEDR
jgi:hypothetical protein